MSDKEKQILETFGKAIPQMTELEKERLLAYGEGIAFKTEQQNSAAANKPPDARKGE